MAYKMAFCIMYVISPPMSQYIASTNMLIIPNIGCLKMYITDFAAGLGDQV